MSLPKLQLVVAVSNNMGIGIEGRIPWRLKQDMTFFKKVTTETKQEGAVNAVIMGRKTWQSIPAKFRPLPNRINVILSSTMTETPKEPETVIAKSLTDALIAVKDKVESIYVIGGSSVYREALLSPNPCRVYLTRVLADFECDVHFPELDLSQFDKIANVDNVPVGELEENGLKFRFEVYDKKCSCLL